MVAVDTSIIHQITSPVADLSDTNTLGTVMYIATHAVLNYCNCNV